MLCLKCNNLALYTLHRMQLSWDNPMQHSHFKRTVLSIWKMIASHRYVGAKGQIDIILCTSSYVTLSPFHNRHHRMVCLYMALLLAVLATRTAVCCKD